MSIGAVLKVGGETRNTIAEIFFGAFAASLNIATTLHFGASEIRIAASDLLLPIAVFVLLRRQPRIPRAVWAWLAVFSAWLTVSLIIGRFDIGAWQSWAVMNKYLGWFALVAYLLVGARIAVNDEGLALTVMRAFVISGVVIACIGITRLLLAKIGLAAYPFSAERQSGLLENPNAFGAAMAATWAIIAASGETLFSRRIGRALAAVAIVGVVFSGSRGAYLGLGICVSALLATHRASWRDAVFSVACAGAVVLISAIPPISSGANVPQTSSTPGLSSAEAVASIEHREHLSTEAISMWEMHPIAGAGLGVFLHQQMIEHRDPPQTIHTTALWLMTETGLIGLALALAFGVYCLRTLAAGDDVLSRIALASLITLAADSVANEMMYQRYLWLILGLALAQRLSRVARFMA